MISRHTRLTWTGRLTILLALAFVYAAGADGGQQQCQQHPTFYLNLKP